MLQRRDKPVSLINIIVCSSSWRFLRGSSYWRYFRSICLAGIDFGIISISYYLSYLLRFDTTNFDNPSYETSCWYVMPSMMVSLYFFGIYKELWRYANLESALKIIKAVLAGLTVSLVVYFYSNESYRIPRSIPIIFGVISIFTLVGSRFSWRLFYSFATANTRRNQQKPRCFLYGAGSAGEQLARHVNANTKFPYEIIGFIDDDHLKTGRFCHGYKVFGTGEDLPYILENVDCKTIILTIHAIPGRLVKKIFEDTRKLSLECLVMPDLSTGISSDLTQLRKVNIEDLLRRMPKSINYEAIHSFFDKKSVLVSGAGGSIGSEIVRQLSTSDLKNLILVDSCEYNLYKIVETIKKLDLPFDVIPRLGSVCDYSFLTEVFQKYQPNYVLHAAAYKHVPMIEENPKSAMRNNIMGTKILVDLSDEFGVEGFTFISTDKAVKPTNIMGSSKRCCELYLAKKSQKNGSKTKFSSVRFGNVLGSSGSVVPKFLEQIRNGGPVTVTHQEVTRFFMLTSEAVGLVLYAATRSSGGETFVLNMGEPIKIIDMAKQLIELAGKIPGQDIEIQETGLREGEKLYEELIIDEAEHSLLHDDIFIARSNNIEDEVFKDIDYLCSLIEREDMERAIKLCKSLANHHVSNHEQCIPFKDSNPSLSFSAIAS